ncbi:MAG: hypothetical protein KDA98_14170, partial [Acidimicrobiales bacterium]|nr:hypothetical protein [Acidimicrobiales bacterium]
VVIDDAHDVARVPGGLAAWEANRRATRPGTGAGGATPRGRRGDTRVRPDPSERRRSPSTLARLMREAEKEQASLERRRDRLAAALAEVDPADHAALAEAGRELAEVEAALAAAEERWLELGTELEG